MGPGEILGAVCLLPSPISSPSSDSSRSVTRTGSAGCLEGARRIRKPEARQSVLDEIAAEAGKAAERLAARAARL